MLSSLVNDDFSKARLSVQMADVGSVRIKELKEEVEVGIISLRNISNGFIPLINKNSNEDFEELLKIVAHQSLVSEEKIEHSIKSEYCKFCTK